VRPRPYLPEKTHMSDEHILEKKEESNSIHIFSVSAAMVGVCLTIIGLFSISQSLKKVETLGDEMVTFNAMLFLISCVLSYLSLKKRNRGLKGHLEKLADGFFISGLSFMVLICVLLVWKLV